MQRRTVVMTIQARSDVDAIADYIAERSPMNADRFIAKLESEIAALAGYGGSVGLAPEAHAFDFALRQIVVYPYRVLFRLTDSAVEILHVRHGSRTAAKADRFGNPS